MTALASTEATNPPVKWQIWTGRVLSALPVPLFLFSASMKFMVSPKVLETFVDKLGYRAEVITPLGILEVVCLIVYMVPRTAVLGAVLLTGYLGGVIATHLRVGDPFILPVIFGIILWAGLYLRDPRLRALLPLRNG